MKMKMMVFRGPEGSGLFTRTEKRHRKTVRRVRRKDRTEHLEHPTIDAMFANSDCDRDANCRCDLCRSEFDDDVTDRSNLLTHNRRESDEGAYVDFLPLPGW